VVRNTHIDLKGIILLPRQAREKHRESSTRKREGDAFAQEKRLRYKDEELTQVRKRHFLRHLYIECIILPRQARDKHRENSKKVPFSLS